MNVGQTKLFSKVIIIKTNFFFIFGQKNNNESAKKYFGEMNNNIPNHLYMYVFSADVTLFSQNHLPLSKAFFNLEKSIHLCLCKFTITVIPSICFLLLCIYLFCLRVVLLCIFLYIYIWKCCCGFGILLHMQFVNEIICTIFVLTIGIGAIYLYIFFF